MGSLTVRLSTCGCAASFLAFTQAQALAQQALLSNLSGETASQANLAQMESMPYTFKLRDLSVYITPSVQAEWNDNVSLSETGSQQQDFILSPTLHTALSYPISNWNLLTVNVGAGYQKYLDHNEYSTWFINSGTQLSFNVYVKDFVINFHDRVAYTRDSLQEAEVANTGQFDNLDNTAGLSATWNLNQAVLTLGYDHENVISGSQEFNYDDHSSELFLVRAGFQFHPTITAGLEGSASFTAYDQMVLNNNSGYSAGVYADWNPGQYFRLQARGGYSIYDFQHTSQSIQTSDLNSYYINLNVTHEATKAIGYSLGAGHEVNLGIQADATEDWFVRPSVHWHIIDQLTLIGSISYEHGTQGAGNISGNLVEEFDWLGAGIGTSYAITKSLTLAFNYNLTIRSSTAAARGYTQDVVTLSLSYHL